MKVKFTQAARKRGIGRSHVLFIMETYAPERDLNAHQEARLTWLGREDDRGDVLDVIAVETVDPKEGEVVILVIHVIPTRYRLRGKQQ